MLTFGSLFSGCGLMDYGLEQSGMVCKWQCEIDKDARRVLYRHWPNLPCHEDVREVGKSNLAPVDVLVGCFPCQDLSVAGQRAGIQSGKRSGLWWEMLRVIGELQPSIVLFENVPGLLSCDKGRDLRRICSSLAEHNYLGVIRTFDSRYFGVAQRRRRLFGVFVRDDPTAGRAAQILAVAEGRSRNPPTSRQERQEVARTLRGRSHRPGISAPGRGGEDDENLVVGCLNYGNTRGGFRTEPGEHLTLARCITACEGKRLDGDSCSFITHTLTSNGADASEDGTVRGTPLIAFEQNQRNEVRDLGKQTSSVKAQPGMKNQTFLAFTQRTRADGSNLECQEDLAYALDAPTGGGRKKGGVAYGMVVRRLTPTECVRLMGAPDNFLDLEPSLSDSAKYRLCGNAVVRQVALWIGKRIVKVMGGEGESS